MKVPILRIPFSEEDILDIKLSFGDILRSGQLAMGKYVAGFEQRFAEFCGTEYAVATNSGTSALEIILRTLDVADGTVIVPTNTFMATATAAVHAGAKVNFADINPETMSLSVKSLVKVLATDNVKAVILVHIGGVISYQYDWIRKICTEYNIPLIEDAAHAHGSSINGTKAGALGTAAAFSFYPTKVLTTGEGGMITTNDAEIYEKARMLRDHGKPDHNFNVHTEFGYNWRMSEFHAAVGLNQLDKAKWIIRERQRLAARYDAELASEFKVIKPPEGIKSSYYKYILFLPSGVDRAFVKAQLREKYDIELTGEVYAEMLHSQPVFSKYPATCVQNGETFEGAAELKSHICLPLYLGLTDEEQDYVCQSLREVVHECG